jgi:uncharacterized membrane protein YozB (DUF420 family)
MTSVLPHLTAGLNALAGILVLIGFGLIRLGYKTAHGMVMTAAIFASALFLAAYLAHHFTAPVFVFAGHGAIRPVYFTMLVSHVALAVVVTPLIIATYRRARRGAYDRHRALALWTVPVWLYVSVTGIAVYVLVYHVYRPGA